MDDDEPIGMREADDEEPIAVRVSEDDSVFYDRSDAANPGPPMEEPLLKRVKYALEKRKSGEQLLPAEKEAIKEYLNNPNGPHIDGLDAVNATSANTAMFDFGDEVGGYLHAGLEKLKGNPEDFASLAEKEKFAIRDYLKRARNQHPFKTGAGSVASAIATGAMLPAGRLANAAQGAVSGYGASESPDFSGKVMDAVNGGATAMVTGRAMEHAGDAAKGIKRAVGGAVARGAQLPGKAKVALQEFLGEKARASPDFGATEEQILLREQAKGPPMDSAPAAPAPVAESAPQSAWNPTPDVVRPEPVNDPNRATSMHSAQKLEQMDTAEAIKYIDSLDPVRKLGSQPNEDLPREFYKDPKTKQVTPEAERLMSDKLGYFEEAMPVWNKSLREQRPDAALVQSGRVPTMDEFNPSERDIDEYNRALFKLQQRAKQRDLQEFGDPNKTKRGKPNVLEIPKHQQGQPRDLNAPDRPAGYDAKWKPGIGDDTMAKYEAEYRAEFPNATDDEVSQFLAEAADYNNTDARYMARKSGPEPTRVIEPEQDEVLPPGRRIYPTPRQGETVTNFSADDATAAHSPAVDNDVTKVKQPDAVSPKQKTEPWNESESLKARERLANQARGKKMLGVGGMTGTAIDFATEFGRSISEMRSGKMPRNAFAQKLATDPKMAAEMAKQPGVMGQAGREILKAMKQGGSNAAKARAWVITNSALFQEK